MNETVKKQILAVRDTGLTNMFDINAVQRIAYDMDFFDLVCFLEEEKAAYPAQRKLLNHKQSHSREIEPDGSFSRHAAVWGCIFYARR